MISIMGQRANLILINKGVTEIFYTHWRANTLDENLFWGPQHSTAFIRSQRPVADELLLDEVWAEGGAVLDHDRQVLLLFGGEDIQYEVPLRHLYLQLIRRVWSGWEVRWAHEGVCDLADYIGRPRAEVLSEKNEKTSARLLKLPDPLKWTRTIGSFVLEGGLLRFFPLRGHRLELEDLAAGPKLIEATIGRGLEEFHMSKWSRGFPLGGFHVDTLRRTVEFWTGREAPDAPRRVAQRWPGWDVTWYRDRFEFQLDRSGGALSFSAEPQDVLIERLRQILLRERTTSGVDAMLEFEAAMRKEGHTVTNINPYSLRDAQLVLPIATKREIFEQALRELGPTLSREV